METHQQQKRKQGFHKMNAVKNYLLLLQLKRIFTAITQAAGAPIILVGMHRSGTSMLTRLLRAAGGYFGAELEKNSEPQIFIALNDAFLKCQNASWSKPATKRNPRNQACTNSILLRNTDQLNRGYYDSFNNEGTEHNSLPYPSLKTGMPSLPEIILAKPLRLPHTQTKFWGWKDPRNTLTIETWLDIFPNAKVIHVIRNGVNSAISLWNRCNRSGAGAPECLDLNYCFHLWEHYTETGLRWRSLGPKNYYEFRYEDFLANPITGMRDTLSFIGTSDIDIEACVNSVGIISSRSTVCLDYPELLATAFESKLFRELGYAFDIENTNPHQEGRTT